MLSIWPNLFDFWLVAPLLLRLGLGVSLFSLYYQGRRSVRGGLGLLTGALIIIGLFTQPAALITSLLLVEEIWHKRQSYNRATLIPLLAIALSLLFLGPGLYAFDLPL
ncbi:MAG TPA: hypothetical protein VJB69_01250 [Candidatus Paceibacterota bacterium]